MAKIIHKWTEDGKDYALLDSKMIVWCNPKYEGEAGTHTMEEYIDLVRQNALKCLREAQKWEHHATQIKSLGHRITRSLKKTYDKKERKLEKSLGKKEKPGWKPTKQQEKDVTKLIKRAKDLPPYKVPKEPGQSRD